MPRISLHKLDKDIEKEMFKQFWNSISKINDAQTASHFFSDILTKTEKVMIAKRFTCAILLIRGKNHSEIRKTIHLSYSAIASVASWIKNAKPKTVELLKNISGEKDWESIILKIEEIIDKIPFKYGGDWTAEGKRKHLRAIQRSVKRNLL